jgi:hypothetical protein
MTVISVGSRREAYVESMEQERILDFEVPLITTEELPLRVADEEDGTNIYPTEFGEALGIAYDDDEPLRVGDKEHERDLHRWELNPASAEDYRERSTERLI